MELKETLKNIKAGIILDGEVYELVKWVACKYCAFYHRMPTCNEPCSAILDVYNDGYYMFKKVEKDEIH